MNYIKLENGYPLVIDAVELDDHLRRETNHLTDNGKKTKALLGTHLCHTLSFSPSYQSYPHAAYFWTPRHLRRLDHCNVRRKSEPDVELRIPTGLSHWISSLIFTRLFEFMCWICKSSSRIIESFYQCLHLSSIISYSPCQWYKHLYRWSWILLEIIRFEIWSNLFFILQSKVLVFIRQVMLHSYFVNRCVIY